MSYLSSALRVCFSGDFTAAPSTVNNDPDHYNNATFRPEFQLPQTATAANGWWNPRGDHSFTVAAKIRGGQYSDGTPVTADSIVGVALRSANTPPGTIVDLDPYQQMVSTLYGVRVSIPNPAGSLPYLQAKLETVSFTEIWSRGQTGSGDERASAAYQSVSLS